MPARGSVFLISSLSDNIVFYLFLNSGIIRCAMYSSYLDNSTLLTWSLFGHCSPLAFQLSEIFLLWCLNGREPERSSN